MSKNGKNEYLVMDVSGWNTNVPYSKLTSLGIEGGIFRITEKGNKKDSMFETHWNGFASNGFNALGVYKYSYAKTIAEIQEEAQCVLDTLGGRKCPLGVWLDLEDPSQKDISKEKMTAMIEEFRDIIVRAGYHFGIYSGEYWMKTYLEPDKLPYDRWLASYAYDGSLKESLRPNFGEKGWQYTSSFMIDGQKYDMSLFEADYIEDLVKKAENWKVNEPTEEVEPEKDIETIEADKDEEIVESAISFMENIARDNSHGYSQESRWGTPDYDCSSLTITAWQQAGVPVKTRGATYTGNMYHTFIACGFKDVTSQVNLATGAGLKRGDVLLNHIHHVAMYCGNGMEVEASINERGGATGGTPGDQTGREILIRSYRNYPWNAILRWGNGGKKTATTSSTLLKKGYTGDAVKDLQQKLVVLGWSLETDGIFGNATLAAVKEFQSKYNLEVDGIVGSQTMKALNDAVGTTKEADKPEKTAITTDVPRSYEAIVIADTLNVRADASTSTAIIGKLYSDELVNITREKDGFGYVPSKLGWVSLNYIRKVTKAVCIGDDVNVRASGNIFGTVIGTANKGDIVKVITTRGSWSNVVVNGIVGWMSSRYVK